MTPNEHLQRMLGWFNHHATVKYTRGQVEHGGRLWKKAAWKLLRDEVIDMPIYFQVLEAQQEEVIHQLEMAANILEDQTSGDHDTYLLKSCVHHALNILTVGNKEGIPEEEK